MHPITQYELARMHMDELIHDAQRERLVRVVRKAGTGDKVRTERTWLGSRLRTLLSGGTATVEPRPADAGA